MRTAYVQDPRPSHVVKVVDKSPAVNSESLIGTHSGHAPVISSRFANLCSTDAIDTLREIDAEPFAVTVNGRTVMVEVLPPIRPEFLIATRRTDTRGHDAITIN